MKEVDKNIVLDEIVRIIFEDKVIKLYNDIEPDYENDRMKGLTLDDCAKIATKKGFKDGTIVVISESYLCGNIYRYNNYSKKEWCQVGTMEGFA